MEHIELVTVSSEADSDDEQEIDNEQEDFNPLIRGGDSTKSLAQIRRTRLVYDPSKVEKLCFGHVPRSHLREHLHLPDRGGGGAG